MKTCAHCQTANADKNVFCQQCGRPFVAPSVGDGDKTEAVVHFRDVGEKRLLLSWAPLTKIGA